VNPEAIEVIKRVPQPIGVLGVAGQYRTGKSFLINQIFLQTSRGFQVDPSINSCTKVLSSFPVSA